MWGLCSPMESPGQGHGTIAALTLGGSPASGTESPTLPGTSLPGTRPCAEDPATLPSDSWPTETGSSTGYSESLSAGMSHPAIRNAGSNDHTALVTHANWAPLANFLGARRALQPQHQVALSAPLAYFVSNVGSCPPAHLQFKGKLSNTCSWE